MLCHYWYLKDVRYKFETHLCNVFHHILMMAYELKNVAIRNVKDVDYSYFLWSLTKNDAIDMLSNSNLGDKGTLRI